MNLERTPEVGATCPAVCTTGTVDVFDQRSSISGPTSWRASALPNLHE